MRSPRLLVVAVLLAVTAGVQLAGQNRPSSDSSARRIVVVGDVHGAAAEFVAILQRAKLIDEQRRWVGGNSILVQTGDVMDRGPRVREALDLLMALEKQAASAGGRVVALLGNHEVMVMTRRLEYVTPADYASFADSRSANTRERAYSDFSRLAADRVRMLGGTPPVYRVPPKNEWMGAKPDGYIEFHEAFAPRGQYGRWLRDKQAMAQIGDTLFLHGGISAAYFRESIDAINRQVQREIRRFDDDLEDLADAQLTMRWFTAPEMFEAVSIAANQIQARPTQDLRPEDDRVNAILRDFMNAATWSIYADDGPLWFRGYALWTDDVGNSSIGDILKSYGAARIVVGHTIREPRISERFGGRAILIDTGMLPGYFPNGRPSALEIQGGKTRPIYLDE